jgi:hypothetical protein
MGAMNKSSIPLPLPESYWVEPGRFLAGEYPASQGPFGFNSTLVELLKAGIDTFIDLTEPHEFASYERSLIEEATRLGLTASYLRFPIEDWGLPGEAQMTAILDAINLALNSGHKLYLHCLGGIGRTGTTVGCYLVRHGLTGDQALDQLAEWWQNVPKRRFYSRSPETESQRDFIRNWHELA